MSQAAELTDANAWDGVFAQLEFAQWGPAEDVVRFGARHLYRRLGPSRLEMRRPVERLLDLGCGVGRHVVHFSKLGIPVWGIDVSARALDVCMRWLADEGAAAQLAQGSVDDLPYPGEHFDVVVSHGVLDQVTLPVCRAALAEVRRVLRPGGLVHLNLRAPDSFDYGVGEEIEHGTWRLASGPEAGLPQHFFTEREVEELIAPLRIVGWETSVRHLDREGERRDTRFSITASG